MTVFCTDLSIFSDIVYWTIKLKSLVQGPGVQKNLSVIEYNIIC